MGRGTASSIPTGSWGSLQPELLWSEFISGEPKLLWRGTRTPEPREETARDCSPFCPQFISGWGQGQHSKAAQLM